MSVPVQFREIQRRGPIRQPLGRAGYEQAIGFINFDDLGVVGVNIPFGATIDTLPIYAVGYSGFAFYVEDSLAPLGLGGLTVFAIHCDPFTSAPLFDPMALNYQVGASYAMELFGANGQSFAITKGFGIVSTNVWHTFVLRIQNTSNGALDDSVTEGGLWATASRYVQ